MLSANFPPIFLKTGCVIILCHLLEFLKRLKLTKTVKNIIIIPVINLHSKRIINAPISGYVSFKTFMNPKVSIKR